VEGNNKDKKILNYAQMASSVWDSMPQEKQQAINRYFHLRPTNSGVTIVSTYPYLPMRGKTSSDRETLESDLDKIFKYSKRISSVDIDRAVEALKEIGFAERNSATGNDLEEDTQALMIQNMSNDENLRKRLGVENKIQFIASELVFERGKHRVDIVGFDGVDLFLLELKKGRTKKVDQVANYVNYYSEPKNLEILKRLLKSYPINPVDNFESIKGVMVMQYAENSAPEKWNKLAEDHSIDILFFEKSLSYK